jgi:prepilin-type N-terminal cleavage/methylation domain-containing protein
MTIYNSRLARDRGFSLIEVMIAVVVLSTGLLALAALQANLTRSAADSKVRSRVAALVSSHMDDLRAQGYEAAKAIAATGCVGGNDVCQAQTDAAIGGLTIRHDVNEVVFAANDARYKTVKLVAEWKDAAGEDRSLSMDTVLSPTALDGTATLVDKELSGDSAKQPIVRTTNPATPGMIPVAVSATDSTAATNPRPELLSQGNNSSVTGTKFDVLTYTNETGGNAQIQRRVETTVIGCTCQYGAGGSNLPEIYRQSQWPAVWTGERYEIYKPDSATLKAPGEAVLSGPAAGVTQSPLCTECCRDHHDTGTSGLAKFDPERALGSGEVVDSHYSRDANGLVLADTKSGVYDESCRMIRVDGIWRTAADMYSRYTGLLATGVASGKTDPATTGVPDAVAAENYGGSPSKSITGFVKDYLAELMKTASSYVGAAKLYDGYGLNSPAQLTIRRPTKTDTDERYLHLRGLYVDHLEQKAKDRIATSLLPANCPGGNKTECVLPYVPFTTINLTELAYWKAQVLKGADYLDDDNILKVETTSALTFNELQPYRGRTNALSNANNTDIAYAVATISKSNSGVAVMQEGVDPDDETISSELPDRQEFKVLASGSSSGTDKFSVRIAGLPQTSDKKTDNDPKIDWFVDTSSGSCGGTLSAKNDYDPNDYACINVPTLNVAGAVRFSNYYITDEETVTQSATCTYVDNKGNTSSVSVSSAASRPYYRNFEMVSATANGVPASPAPTPTGDGLLTESTTANFALIPSNALVIATFQEQTKIVATVASCTAKSQGGKYVFASITWGKSWQ